MRRHSFGWPLGQMSLVMTCDAIRGLYELLLSSLFHFLADKLTENRRDLLGRGKSLTTRFGASRITFYGSQGEKHVLVLESEN